MSDYVIPVFKVRLVRDGNLKLPSREIACAEHCAAVFMQSLAGLPHEEIHALYLGTRHNIVGFSVLASGGIAGASITPGDVFRGAIACGAIGIILAHNHPSGDPSPSPDDLTTTGAIRRAGALLGITLLDHLVCCPETGRWRSLIDLPGAA